MCTIDDVVASMDPQTSKIWVCEQLIGNSGEIPELIFVESQPWWSFFRRMQLGG